jgi:hypothetical protein
MVVEEVTLRPKKRRGLEEKGVRRRQKEEEERQQGEEEKQQGEEEVGRK